MAEEEEIIGGAGADEGAGADGANEPNGGGVGLMSPMGLMRTLGDKILKERYGTNKEK